MNLISVMEFFGKYAKHAGVIYIVQHYFFFLFSITAATTQSNSEKDFWPIDVSLSYIFGAVSCSL